ncbi:MAG: response regulator, partial [Lachnospiraceae bacterium]|nr:response regulator [Lachnospiraceae bacterium]
KQNKIRFKARLSGRQEVYMASMTAALDRYQDPYGYVIAMTDITKEEALILEAESGSRAKSNFLANMSHEIRTPMNVIRGMAEVILRDSSDEEARKNAGMIVTASESLLSIINDILDFSKIESGKLEILEEPFHLLSLINDVVTMIGIRLKDTQVELITRVDPEIPSGLLGDELRIKQVLINLLNNAVKFTRQGSVTLKVSCEITDQTQCLLRMDVIDTGIGIREEDLQQIFESFTQVDARINREVEGTGLGLAISRNLVRAMGGEIGAKSQYGEGSDFYLTIPCKITDPKPCGDLREDRNLRVQEAFKPAFKAEGARVLVVDDNDMNLQVAEGLLKPYGILPTKVQSGIAAVRCVEKMELFDLIFMDHMMPGMDGMEAMQKIREMQPEQHVPIIALTANAISGMEQQYRQAGFDGFLAKPIEPEKLDGLLRKYLKQ